MEDTAIWTGIYGAILSTILAVIKIVEIRRDRPVLKVTVSGDWIFHPNPFPGEKTTIAIKAVNLGHRPITLTGAGLLMPGKRYLMCADSISQSYAPVELAYGKAKEYYMGETSTQKEYKLAPDKYVAYIKDMTGRAHYSHNIFQRWFKLKRLF